MAGKVFPVCVTSQIWCCVIQPPAGRYDECILHTPCVHTYKVTCYAAMYTWSHISILLNGSCDCCLYS